MSPLTTVSPGGNVPIPSCSLTVANGSPPNLTCNCAYQPSYTGQRALLRTVAVQWTVPSGLQEMTTRCTDRLQTLHPFGVGVAVAVAVAVGVGVAQGSL